ncbi:MAG TPA: thiamine pyrophosphate-dependent enzyme [Bacteroidales bacterium]|jgi:2-oxoglutarate ferredoxin oxidoreductase subunit beta|nr:2-oxoglutarate oxidoreductase [Bacteroidales bacterium]OQC37696.1 MAG: 2-oxoglutarate oxidoreductase subunit KorB [Bacteroidetes bacterium ADurb.Bin041]MBP7873205.1 2-oxoglutarate oxidoreductase [Bacteroidales bacterium]MCO6468864.1 2-oxoglutarate oxidoreductase [Bacteroidales bacterium]MCZ2281944.1 2-oxoglutarate oxidoreductase [Bacteroidales bacterium]
MKLQEIIKEENLVYKRTPLMTDNVLSYCPGCGHGTAHRIVMEVIEEMGVQADTIGIAPVGCSVLAYDFMNIDMVQAAHGRAPAVATGIKRTWPDKFVFTYQGDGDLAAIGTAETIHACNRGENITIIFINNGIYGMTGGQMAPTTIEGMKTSTSPYGRDLQLMGNPLKITELVAQLPGTYFVARHSVHNPAAVRKTKRAVQKAFQIQKERKGLAFIEIVSNCNSGWKLPPVKANQWMVENMFPFFPPGDIKVDGELVKKE